MRSAGINVPQTPPSRSAAAPVQTPPRGYAMGANISERKKTRVPKRRLNQGIAVLEAPSVHIVIDGEPSHSNEIPARQGKRARQQSDDQDVNHGYSRLNRRNGDDADESEGEINNSEAVQFAPDFGGDYFASPACARLRPKMVEKAVRAACAPAGGAAASDTRASQTCQQLPQSDCFAEWCANLRRGFSLLLQGVGSKRRLLEAFADELFKKHDVFRVDCYDARLVLADCLRDLLEQTSPGAPRSGTSPEALANAIISSRSNKGAMARPLYIVAHNLELLSAAHQSALASLVASPGVHLACSVDNVYAPLLWDPRTSKDFNFWRVHYHTYQSCETEMAAKYPGGLPAWATLSADQRRCSQVDLGLVLKSLTPNHRELVGAIAKNQLSVSSSKPGGKHGISLPELLQLAADRMIANTVTKLKGLLNELKDHEIVRELRNADNSTRIHLPHDDRVLRKLAKGGSFDEDSDGDDE